MEKERKQTPLDAVISAFTEQDFIEMLRIFERVIARTDSDNENQLSVLDREIRTTRMGEKVALEFTDMMEIYGCGIVKAHEYINEIRRTCGGGRLGAGKVLPSEHEYWRNHPKTNYVKYI